MRISKIAITVVALCWTSLPFLFWTQHAAKEQQREHEAAVEYTKAQEYQRAEQVREEENRRIVRIFKDRYFNQIADAIFLAEGGRDTRYPYGIKSVLVRGEAEARLVCVTTIESAWNRYEKTDCTDFIVFLAAIYCPIADDPDGHGAWITNVRYFVNKPKPLP